MILDLEKLLGKRVIYGVIDEENKRAYIGLTEDMALTRLGQHLDKHKTIKKYILNEKPKKLEIEILYTYKRNHKNIRKLLEEKENYFMKKYHKLGYELINVAKMKKLGLA